MDSIYIRIDCDNVGDKIELALYKGDTKAAQEISTTIKINIANLCSELQNKFLGEILLIGSDDILFKTSREHFNLKEIEELKETFFSNTEISISIGIGTSVMDSIQNLNIAKFSGRNRIVFQ